MLTLWWENSALAVHESLAKANEHWAQANSEARAPFVLHASSLAFLIVMVRKESHVQWSVV